MSGIEIYVYYRLAPADEAAAGAQVLALQQRLCKALPGLQARLLRRSGEVTADAGSSSTWMEIYRHADGLQPDQLMLIRQASADLPQRRIGARHEECFEPIERCTGGGATKPAH